MEIDKLSKQIRKCRACREKFGFNPKPIVNKYANPKIIQISQAPSKKVEETGKSFNDKSGERLKYEWFGITDEIFYNPKNFYITSLGHCYPGKSRNKGDNKPPKKCLKWLKKELAVTNCELYIIIGAMAAKYIFPKEKFNDLVYRDNFYNNTLTFVLPHPSPLNSKWFKDNPYFFTKRLPVIRKKIKEILNL